MSIFLPAAGGGYGPNFGGCGHNGYYWSSLLDPFIPKSHLVWHLEFDSGTFNGYYYRRVYYGYSVRPR